MVMSLDLIMNVPIFYLCIVYIYIYTLWFAYYTYVTLINKDYYYTIKKVRNKIISLIIISLLSKDLNSKGLYAIIYFRFNKYFNRITEYYYRILLLFIIYIMF